MTEDAAAAFVGAGVQGTGGGGGGGGSSCPAWCVDKVQHSQFGGNVHRSEGREIPVTRHWWCRDMQGTGADRRCTAGDGIVAFLTMTDEEGITEVVLQHGSMELPHFRLDAAEKLAGHLLGLVHTAGEQDA